jgi:histone-lysine N-methyltransferase ASH1L
LREEETKTPSEEPAAPAPPPRYKPKRWLSHGLYTGQEPSDSPPKQRRSKNSAKTTTGPTQRRLLPMPMFTGSRIVNNGRDYVLPFDIFSPLPPGQPKPDEWRKTNKSKLWHYL